jgi:hypothetical protein
VPEKLDDSLDRKYNEPEKWNDLKDDGQLIQRRYYGKTGKSRLDIDMTDHGNPKEHAVVPHYQNWHEIDNTNVRREISHDTELKIGDRIANEDIGEKER